MDPPSQNSRPNQGGTLPRSLPILDTKKPRNFIKPVKKINENHDVPHFFTSQAYGDLGVFIMQLNHAMCPRKSSVPGRVQRWQLDSPMTLQEPVRKLQELLQTVDALIEEAPPDTGPRRFGNVSFRKWHEILESRVQELLNTHVPKNVLHFGDNSGDQAAAVDELIPYFLGAFGSAQRLDYGTGHELSFLAFLGCIWKLGGFTTEPSQDGSLERSIVIAIVEPYLQVIRRLILTYTLEPAGSHGVWGLDDHFFLPYILGSAQYCPAITDDELMPVEGSLPNSPDPGDVVEKNIVKRERKHNMYFSAVGFIDDVKTGPFWEHSPILFDISGLRSGWGKINKGMIKMYNAEVLSKFPVVQHFPFGSLFSWEQDPNAFSATSSLQISNQPSGRLTTPSVPTAPTVQPAPQEGTRAPWANQAPSKPLGPSTVPWTQTPSSPPQGVMHATRAPWASNSSSIVGSKSPSATAVPSPYKASDGPTRAPWADPKLP